jgi:hypothetical protein
MSWKKMDEIDLFVPDPLDELVLTHSASSGAGLSWHELRKQLEDLMGLVPDHASPRAHHSNIDPLCSLTWPDPLGEEQGYMHWLLGLTHVLKGNKEPLPRWCGYEFGIPFLYDVPVRRDWNGKKPIEPGRGIHY